MSFFPAKIVVHKFLNYFCEVSSNFQEYSCSFPQHIQQALHLSTITHSFPHSINVLMLFLSIKRITVLLNAAYMMNYTFILYSNKMSIQICLHYKLLNMWTASSSANFFYIVSYKSNSKKKAVSDSFWLSD